MSTHAEFIFLILDSVSTFVFCKGIRFTFVGKTCSTNMFVNNSFGLMMFGLRTGTLIEIDARHLFT